MTEEKCKCKHCKYWTFIAADLGYCKYNPPLVNGWPITKAHEWCGKCEDNDANLL